MIILKELRGYYIYYVSTIQSTLRVPPGRFDEDLKVILLELARDSLEERIFENLGFIVAVLDAGDITTGRLIPGDGGAFYDSTFTVLSYLPERGEVIEGAIIELIDFGAFVRVSTVDALCHVSQMANDFFSYNSGQDVLIGKQSNLTLRRDDVVRGRIVVVSVQRNAIRVGITMRQAGLGKLDWIEEWKQGFEGGN
ncbi:MAG: DNA-directed RNA polymerase [Candidatus Heimdallarchaeota archaeon]|nr:DNA-directed RNA polymerase [Candidatus Heimdallarchaeota archaeon]